MTKEIGGSPEIRHLQTREQRIEAGMPVSQLVNAEKVLFSFAGQEFSDAHLGTIGFLGAEIKKLLPDKSDSQDVDNGTQLSKNTAVRRLQEDARILHEYVDAKTVLNYLVTKETVIEAIDGGYIDQKVIDSIISQIDIEIGARSFFKEE